MDQNTVVGVLIGLVGVGIAYAVAGALKKPTNDSSPSYSPAQVSPPPATHPQVAEVAASMKAAAPGLPTLVYEYLALVALKYGTDGPVFESLSADIMAKRAAIELASYDFMDAMKAEGRKTIGEIDAEKGRYSGISNDTFQEIMRIVFCNVSLRVTYDDEVDRLQRWSESDLVERAREFDKQKYQSFILLAGRRAFENQTSAELERNMGLAKGSV